MLKYLKCIKPKLLFIMQMFLFFTFLYLIFTKFLLMETKNQNLNKINETSFRQYSIGGQLLSAYNQTVPVENYVQPNAISPFPTDGFTREQRQQGWIIIHIVLLFYGFWFLACICDDYLMPTVELICSSFNIEHHILKRTVTTAAISTPQLFMNCIDTFIMKNDIGVGTVMGSAVFNLLAVPSCCGLFAVSYIKLDWWPITIDVVFYCVTVLALLIISLDNQVWWYEAFGLLLAYFLYMLIMAYSSKLQQKLKKILMKFGYYESRYKEVTQFTYLLSERQTKNLPTYTNLEQPQTVLCMETMEFPEENFASPWSKANQTISKFVLSWPICFLLWLTVPNSRRHNSLKYFTLLISLLWVAVISYFLAGVTTIIGNTFNIPDAVMGFSILTFGFGIPIVISSVIVILQEEGFNKSLSTILGLNTCDILLNLGLPWLIKALFLPEVTDRHFLLLNANTLEYPSVMLLTAIVGLYILLVCNKFVLNWRVGVSCMCIYLGFIVAATLIELDEIF